MRNLIQDVQRSLVASSLVAVSMMCGAGAAAPEPTPVKIDKTVNERARLNDEVLRLSQPLKCSADADCAALPMGAKPCGGPWKYVLYSKKNAKIPALKKKLAEYNRLDQKINESQQTMSDCSVTLEPEPKCVNAMCVDSSNVNAANASAGLEKITPAPPPHPMAKPETKK